MRPRRTRELRPMAGHTLRVCVGWHSIEVELAAFDALLFGVSLEGAATASASLALLAVALDEK